MWNDRLADMDLVPRCGARTEGGKVCNNPAGYGTYLGVGHCATHRRNPSLTNRAQELYRTFPAKIASLSQLINKPKISHSKKDTIGYIMSQASLDTEVRVKARKLLLSDNLLNLRVVYAMLLSYFLSMDFSETSPRKVTTLSNALTRTWKAIQDVEQGRGNYIHIATVGKLVSAFVDAAQAFIPDPENRQAYARLVQASVQRQLKSAAAQKAAATLLNPVTDAALMGSVPGITDVPETDEFAELPSPEDVAKLDDEAAAKLKQQLPEPPEDIKAAVEDLIEMI